MLRRRLRLSHAKLGLVAALLLLGAAGCSCDSSSALPFYADVFVAAPASSEVRRVSPGDGLYYLPCIHPAGTHVAFCGAAAGPPRVWEVDLATGEVLALTPPNSAAMQPSYSWDGRLIVFTSDRAAAGEPMQIESAIRGGRPSGGPFDLYRLDRASGAVVRLTDGSSIDYRPTFSPDSKTVAFASMRDSPTPRLWRVAAAGAADAELLLPKMWVARPWYSADGESLFFHASVRGRHHACRLDFASRRIEPLANDTFDRTHGCFVDPTTESLLVHARRDGRWGLWELPLDGGPATSIMPPGVDAATHVTRSRNGVIAFDQARNSAAP